MTEPLFHVPGAKPSPPPEKLTAAQRRIQRRDAAMAAGQHPLAPVLRTPIALHADAAPGGDRMAAGLRCGGCAWRSPNYRGFAKCWVGEYTPRATFGPGTDVRAWWPACVDYEPKGAPR